MEVAAPTQTELLGTTPEAATTPPPLARCEKPERNLWREQEMLTVLQIIREHKYLVLLNDKTVRSETVFRNIEKEMNDRGLRKKNFQQIWTKWKFLKSTYMTSRRIHQIPKIIPLDVYESLDELLSAEFRNDGSVSSYDDAGEYDECGGVGGGGGSGGGMASYDMMNASASTGSNDGLLVISNVQGGVPYSGARNFPNGFGGRKLKNGFRSFKKEDDTNGFGMQHPIFGYRLGVVKDEPIDDEYENTNNADESYSDIHLEEPSNTQEFQEIKAEQASPPHSTTPPPEEDHLLAVPTIQLPPVQGMSSCSTSHDPITDVASMIDDSPMPPLHRYTPPPYPMCRKPELTLLPPPLKEIPLVKIALPSKPQIIHIPQQKYQPTPAPQPAAAPKLVNSKKIPVLTLRKRKKRLNIPQLSDEGTNSPVPCGKQLKISEEDDSKEPPSEASRIPFVTYGKAMREMSISLRDIQREMIDDFFKQQMELAKSEHEFQKKQDAMLLRCFEEQTTMLLEGAKKLFTANVPMTPDVVYINDE